MYKCKEKWTVMAKRADFQGIAAAYGINQVTARIMRNRDVITNDEIQRYLHGSRKDLYDPYLLSGTKEAAELLKRKIDEGKKIRIIGDYDIDGVNATYILYCGLKRLGAVVDYEIPDRMKDGYGLNLNLIRLAKEESVDTIVTCDNGISAIEQIAYAKEHGMSVIVTDHHEPLYHEEGTEKRWDLPCADVLIDPKLPDCPYPAKNICGAVVAWKMIQVLYDCCGIDMKKADEFLEFAAIATVGDVMDLVDENRIIVKEGLKKLNLTLNPGLQALIRANGLDGADITSYHIGFVLGPCINASGRLDTAKRSLKLLLTKDRHKADYLAGELKQLNDQRKDMTMASVEEAIDTIDHSDLIDDRVLVVYLPHCHESIAGIVAGKIREHYNRPVFVLTDSAHEGILKGSGRSIEEYSMFDEMVRCQELFIKFGGHPMAAGLSIDRDNLKQLRKMLNQNCTLNQEDLTRKVKIDVPMPLDYITMDLVNEFHVLEPFGKGNEKPVFAEKNLAVRRASILGKNRNVLKLQVVNERGTCMDALYFGNIDSFFDHYREKFGSREVDQMMMGRNNAVKLAITYYPNINEFQNRQTLQVTIMQYQ